MINSQKIVSMKICKWCNCKKSIDDFSIDKRNKDLHNGVCKECLIGYRKNYYKCNKTRIITNNKKWSRENPIRIRALNTIKHHSNKNNIINISVDEVVDLLEKSVYCPICGQKFTSTINGHQRNAPSLDRLNNEKELRVDNVWVICRKCNSTKLDRTMKEFYEYCNNVVTKFKNTYGELSCR